MKFLLHLLDRRPHLQSTLWIQGWVGTFLGRHNQGKRMQMTTLPTVHMRAKALKVAVWGELQRNIWISRACRQPLQCEPLCSCEPGQMKEDIYSHIQFILADTFHLLGKLTNFPQESRYPWISKLFGYQNHEGESGAKPTFPQSISLSFKIQGADSSWPFSSIPIILQCHQLVSHKSKGRISLWKMLVKVLPWNKISDHYSLLSLL